ncbi:MAG: hypothetical protein ACYTG7_22930 [Planctomycetota bacterium]|jgi:hypothetical protein
MGVTYQCIYTTSELGTQDWVQDPTAWCLDKLAEGHPVCLSVWSGFVKRGALPGQRDRDKWYYHVITLWDLDPVNRVVTITDSDDGIDGPRTLSYTFMKKDWIIYDLYPGFRRFHVNSALCISSRLEADAQVIKVADGGTILFDINAGKENADRFYLLLASKSGTYPGILLPGGATLPLNWDFFLELVLIWINTPYFDGFMGTLDQEGKAFAQFLTPAGALTPFLKENLHFAYALTDGWDFASNPIPVQIVK